MGAWAFGADANNPAGVITYLANGSVVLINSTGFERGLYSWAGNAAGGAIVVTTLYDTNGNMGFSGLSGFLGRTLTIAGDTATSVDTNCGTCPTGTTTRIAGGAGSIVGGWMYGNSAQPDNTFVLVFLGSSAGYKYFAGFDSPAGADDYAEIGTYSWDPITHELIATTGGVSDPGNFVTLTPDALGLHVVDDGGESSTLTRVIDPATIPVITFSQPPQTGIAGQAFSYTDLTATNTVTFSATGLPDGLSINSSTGEISGLPSVGGQFAVTIFATSAIGVSDIETLVLTIAIPTPIGQNVVVQTGSAGGPGPRHRVVRRDHASGHHDRDGDRPERGATGAGAWQRVSRGNHYQVQTTAVYQGLITLCFSYAGVDFGTDTPRLFHYEDNEWVDITTSVDPATETICGATTSLSPFAVFASPIVRTGFYAPMSPIAGFLNTVKGGSTVPLKFDVSVGGVEKTTTDGLVLTLQSIGCDSGAPEDLVEPAATTGGTSLRYDATAGYFIQNWKVPKTPDACYMVRMTTEADGLALSARFKVKK